jgi:nicotinate-nucleotide pyrophosphorylase (carboxylating)
MQTNKTDFLNAIIATDVARALAEDVGERAHFGAGLGDLTASLIPAGKRGHARVITREVGVLAGVGWFNAVFTTLDPTVKITWYAADGDAIAANALLCEIDGDARAMLTAERSALNFVQLLSAVATKTQRYVAAVAGTKAKILDTRKTLPGLRLALKYAVTCGGGVNHRVGLYDGILIKENHIAAAGSISLAVAAAQAIIASAKTTMLMVEVEDFTQLQEALACGVTLILLDNMNLAQLREAVAINVGRAQLEASGGITLLTVADIAATGVDRISIGALTKDIAALDLSMRFTMAT